jgi:hypothetical protein
MAEAVAGEAGGGVGGSAVVDTGSGQTVLGGNNATTTQGAGGTAGEAGTDGAANQGAAHSGATAQTSTANTTQTETSAVTTDGNTDTSAAEVQNAAIEYVDFSVPEGITLNPELLGEFKGIAQGLGLKQEQAQQLTDLGVKLTNGLLAQQAQALATQKTTWLNETKADAEIGGDKFAASMDSAARAVKQFVPDDLKALFDQTGIGNHPALVKAFVKIGAMLKEDGVVTGGANSAGDRSAKAMYPNSPGLL